MAIVYFLQAGKENSQNQVLAYFERTAIGKPDSVFYFRPQKKIGYPDCSYVSFSKSSDFGKTLYLLVNRASFPNFLKKFLCFVVAKPSISVLGHVEGYERNFKYSGCEAQKSVLGDMEWYKKFLKKFEFRPSTFTENCAWLSREKIF